MKYKQNHFQIYCFKIIIIIVIASQRKYSSQINRFFKNAKKKKNNIRFETIKTNCNYESLTIN